ncbi:HEPN domain-containing protein [Nocardia brasiliensis]|uniref:HEPN domain-containing protein n=1 Tax=Nocardia brasiliensis TaxID=37326 RepID=UPI0024561794|nr:HEPN domain-containing protein [Nocardia brasiliensis]
MASDARRAFQKNCEDLDILLGIAREKDVAGDPTGEVVCRAAIVSIASYWEAYCEDIASEGLVHLVEYSEIDDLPAKLRRDLATDLKTDKNDIAVRALAGDGWRAALKKRLEDYTTKRNWSFNSPKPGQVDELFDKALGIPRISASWKWNAPKSKRVNEPPTMTAAQARTTLTRYIELRGEIAHRGTARNPVTVADAEKFYEFINRLVAKTGGEVNKTVKGATGLSLWD